MQLRDYQQRTVTDVTTSFSQGATATLVVAPTGSGKTVIGTEIVKGGRTLWLAHRRELVTQARRTLSAEVGRENVGVIMAGECETPGAPIQIASVDTLRMRGLDRGFDTMVLDEAHHYVADTYREIVNRVKVRRAVGLTATPERYDGRPLGDIFQHMVVAASYSELISAGHIVPVQVVRPQQCLGNDLAADPLEAWEKWANGGLTFAFFARVDAADRAARRWKSRGVRAALIEAKTGKTWRDDAIDLFATGRLSILTNVCALTEGVDVPGASVALSCKSYQFAGNMIQAFGRVLRPDHGKRIATVIDLTGVTHRHGLPTEDREYSLTGRAIKRRENAVATPPPPVEFSQEVVASDLEVVTLGEQPSGPVNVLPWVRRASVPDAKLAKVRAKHGKRGVECALDYFDRLGG